MIDKLCDWEIRLELNKLRIKEVEIIIDEQVEALQKRLKILELKKIALKIYEISLHNNAASLAEQQEQVIKEVLLTHIEDDNMLGAYYKYSALSMYYSIIKNVEKRIEYVKLSLNLIEQNPNFLEANFRIYIALVNNYMNALNEKGLVKEIEDFIKTTKVKIQSLNPSLRKESKISGLISLFNAELFLYINNHKDELNEDVNEYAKYLIGERLLSAHHFQLLELYKNIIHVNFLKGNFLSALYYVNEILKNNEFKTRPDIYFPARLWELILHHELKNNMLLHNMADSTHRFLKRNHKLSSFDSELIQYLKTEDPEKKLKHCIWLIQFFNEKEEVKFAYSLLQEHLNIHNWLLSKEQL